MDPNPTGRIGQADAKRLFSVEAEGSIDLSARAHAPAASKQGRRGSRRKNNAEAEADEAAKRRCVSTACIACRKRKSKCDGNTPACAACSQVYGTECIYDPNSDHRRKGVYKNDIDSVKTRNTTLHTLIQAILNYPEDDIPDLVREIRTCESLDAVAEKIVAKEHGLDAYDDDDEIAPYQNGGSQAPTFETQLYGKLGDLRLDDGSVRYIGGTSNLIHLTQEDSNEGVDEYSQQEDPITSWTEVTDDPELVVHLLNMYFTWHYTYFTTLSKTLFYRDFLLGQPPETTRRKTYYCSPLLVNAILALGCHFTSHSGAREDPEDSATAGDHFFKEAKRLIMENDEHEKPRLATVQALALMSVREAGCGREAKGWVYSGMSFRMACDMGLNLDSGRLTSNKGVNGDEAEEDVRRITFWGCFLFDKCWSNYLGRLPQLPTSIITVPKVEVFLDEDAAQWTPYTDSGFTQAHAQPARTRTVALQITKLCEISNDLMKHFYNPTDMERTKGKAAELKKLSDIHTRLESWRRDLPKELEPKEGGLSSVLVMHMFFQLLFIHLFRPFLKYTQATSPLPHTVSPRKLCTQAACMISKLMRLYKRSHGLRQICNIAVYIVHSACTIHLLNIPEKSSKRDIVHGVKHLEEIAEGWLCARRTLGILSVLATRWNVELPDEASAVLARTDAKFGTYNGEISSPSGPARRSPQALPIAPQYAPPAAWQSSGPIPNASNYFPNAAVGAGASSGASTVRNNSSSYALPPQDANGLLAQQHPSAVATPASAQGSQLSKESGGTKTATSPSDIFGGVDQLIRDSQDWVYRDQAQFATGFENWNELDLDPSTWTNSVAGEGVMTGGMDGGMNGDMNGGAVGGPVTRGTSMPNVSAAYANGNGNGTHPSNASPMMNRYSGTTPYGNMVSYNENEWYS
ncbi:Nitrogen assimilation transcription factor nit-4 [Oleoguttula mirabilis]|uniref:Nitrogen assimilation transcription factor nit-4 n=1 Tax=Oleoguttula mirabilis TaxID=1507867 RepID=A0AAV9JGA2_9PEZI|nr:Nitrogen assimilation transcription factor nit-4 [Oleoguttula mirabilis]